MAKQGNSLTDDTERVTSTYAEIYFDDDHCDYKKIVEDESESVTQNDDCSEDDWVSPSDLLIGIIELKPPFTSKITRGKTHEGILAIGNSVLETERAKFLKHLTELINDNDKGWTHILESEKQLVSEKVKKIYNNIFLEKGKIMSKEISIFYEKSLQELETNIKSELQVILTSAHASIISDLNVEIKHRLAKEKCALQDVLKKRYDSEVNKLTKYYKLLLDNELNRNNQLINQALYDRNDALTAFYRQIEAENVTSTMYVLCEERKKCKIKQFILDNYQTIDISERMQKIKEKDSVLNAFEQRDEKISVINKAWEDKIKKVLHLFLKFISFSLKLLPEQSTFLLDLEKMVVLQMNEIQKQPQKAASILIEEVEFKNIFKFEDPEIKETVNECEPFVIVGNLNPPTPPKYGSRETLASDVDLPYIRVQRKFVYAKCHEYEEIKAFLESQRCKCQDIPSRPPSDIATSSDTLPPIQHDTPKESISSDEPMLIDDTPRLRECPARNCQDWTKRLSFPYINSYLDFTEEKFERVKAILGKPLPKQKPPKLIDPSQLVRTELPFSATKERFHTVETQYSSQEDLYFSEVGCSCVNQPAKKVDESNRVRDSPSVDLRELLHRRKLSLRNILQDNPNLLKIFTDECFDFIL